MIILEKRLAEAFSTLPQICGFSPTFRWGNEDHLLKQLTTFQKANRIPYPLIYLISNQSDYDSQKRQLSTRLTLILATRNVDTSQLNETRWSVNYNNALFPLAENINKLFTKGGMFSWDGNYTLTSFPNYGDGEKNKTADIWDALRFETNIIINSNCLGTVYY